MEEAIFYEFEVDHEGELFTVKKAVKATTFPRSNLTKYTKNMAGKKLPEGFFQDAESIDALLKSFVGNSYVITIADTPEAGRTYIDNISIVPTALLVPKKKKAKKTLETAIAEANHDDEMEKMPF